MKLSEQTCTVVDSGLFPHIALCLAQKCKRVNYVGPRSGFMPHLADGIVGDGFDNIVRLSELWGVKQETDFFCFTDSGYGGEQRELKAQGYPVWGHMGADVLEVKKGLFVTELEHEGLAVPPFEPIEGLDRLREHLSEKEDKFIKISRWRGDWETLHWRNRELDEIELLNRACRLGPARNKLTYYVFDKIDTDIEDGIDTWRIKGQWPKLVLHAMERKDRSLIGKVTSFDEIAQPVREVNERFAEALDRYNCNGAFSTEIRIAEQPYFNDPTIRFGSPPSQLQTVLIRNLAEIIEAGARGEILEIEAPEAIGAQVLITTDRAKDDYLSFPMPDELRPWVKSSFACEIDGTITVAPNPLENWAGWLTATGNSVAEVIRTLNRRKELLPPGFDCDLTSLAELLREMESAKSEGVTITKETTPDPEIVLEEV